MSEDERSNLTPDEDDPQSTELQRSSWLLEHAEVVDDVIEDLSARAVTKKDLRDLVSSAPLYPEGENIDEDFGYVMCEPSRTLIVRLIHAMLDVDFQFRGMVYRDKAILTTVLIGFGLLRIEGMLTKRKERIRRDWQDLWDDKTRFSIQDYRWRKLAATEKGEPFYKFNYYVLDATVRGRINKIKREYRLSRAFLAEMSIVEAIRTSRHFPESVIKRLDDEHDQFAQWAKVKEAIDTIDLQPPDESE